MFQILFCDTINVAIINAMTRFYVYSSYRRDFVSKCQSKDLGSGTNLVGEWQVYESGSMSLSKQLKRDEEQGQQLLIACLGGRGREALV